MINLTNKKHITPEEFAQYAQERNIELIHEKDGFKTGEWVDVVNGYGIIIYNKQIKGFLKNPDPKFRPEAIAFVYDDAYWFPIEIKRLIKKEKSK